MDPKYIDSLSQQSKLLMQIAFPHVKLLQGGCRTSHGWRTGYYLYDTENKCKLFEPVRTRSQAWEKGLKILQVE